MIHAAILGGTLLFFAVVFFLIQGREARPSVLFRWAWLALAITGAFGAGYVRGRLPRGADPVLVLRTGIIIWAFAESVALFGLACALVSTDLVPALGATAVGVFLMVYHRPNTLG